MKYILFEHLALSGKTFRGILQNYAIQRPSRSMILSFQAKKKKINKKATTKHSDSVGHFFILIFFFFFWFNTRCIVS